MSYLENTKYSLDWLQGVLPFDNVSVFFKALGDIDDRLKIENWSHMGNLRNYNTRFICSGHASVSIAYNQDYTFDPYINSMWYDGCALQVENHPYNPGIFVSISGDGLRWLNQVDGTVDKLIKYLRVQAFKCSRLDLACDIFDPKNELVPTVIRAFKNCFDLKLGKVNLISNMRRTSGKNGSVKLYPYFDGIRHEKPKQVWNVSFGNHGSSFGMFRCYDKWFEIASGRLNNYSTEMLKELPNKYWYRLEYEVHNGKTVAHAESIFNSLADGEINIQGALGIVAGKMFKIILPSNFTNLGRAPICDIWQKFIEHTIHFVELGVINWVTTPWVEKLPEQFKYYVRTHIPKMVYKIYKMFEASPELKEQVLADGEARYNRDTFKKAEFDRFCSMLN